MKKFLLVDLFDGSVKGTDSEEKAQEYSHSEEFFVIDTSDQTWFSMGESLPVKDLDADGATLYGD